MKVFGTFGRPRPLGIVLAVLGALAVLVGDTARGRAQESPAATRGRAPASPVASDGAGSPPQTSGHAPSAPLPPSGAAPEEVAFRRFGKVHLWRAAGEPAAIIVLASDLGGWSASMNTLARELAQDGNMVVGFDARELIHALDRDDVACFYPAGDLEGLSHFIELHAKVKAYREPFLAGIGAGGTLLLATLAQAPAHIFAGVVTAGFTPNLRLARGLCRGNGLKSTHSKGVLRMSPIERLPVPWRLLPMGTEGEQQAGLQLARATPGAEVKAGPVTTTLDESSAVHLGAAMRAFVNEQRLVLEKARAERHAQLAAPVATAEPGTAAPSSSGVTAEPDPHAALTRVDDLPLEEVPARSAGGKTLAIVLSGDGGWADIDKVVCKELAAAGVACVGLNSLHYFWQPRTAEGGATDLARIVRHYLARWSRTEVALIGYSFGADVAPFFFNRLPNDVRDAIKVVALLGPTGTAAFEFHVTDWFGGDGGEPTVPEIDRIEGATVLCIHGSKEKDSPCPKARPKRGRNVQKPGAHHFDGDYPALARLIMDEMTAATRPAAKE